MRSPGETPDQPLPATGTRCTFRLQTGLKPVGRKVEALIEIQTKADPPELRVNGVLCGAPRSEKDTVLLYVVPAEALTDRCHVLEVASQQTITITRVEFAIGQVK